MVHRLTAESLSSNSPLVKQLVVVAAFFTLAAGGTTGYTIWRSRLPDPNAATAAAAVAASQLTTVTALGRLEPRGEVIKVSGSGAADGSRIDRLLVKEGDRVKTGETIAILDNRDRQQAAFDQAQQQVRVSQANLAKVKAGAKNGEIQAQKATIGRLEADRSNEIAAQQAIVARLEVDRSTEITAQQATIARLKAEQQGEIQTQQAAIARIEAELRNATNEQRRYSQLYQQGAISASTSDSKTLATETAQQQLNEGKAKLNQIQQSRQQQINEAQAKLNQIQQSRQQQINEAQAKLSQIQESRQQQIGEAEANLDRIAEVRPVDIEAAAAEVGSAQAAAKQAKANLALAYIHAPRDAQVLKIHTYPGEKVGNDGIVELGQTREMLAVAEIYQSDVDKVRIGQPAKITSDSFQGELQGKVEYIGLQVQRQNIVNTDPSANIDARIVEVKVRLDAASSQKVAGLTNLQVKVAIGGN
ncbi:MAG: biotin/lipoyl-binding protein [Microcoleus sp. PH2017_29_MFU_D_A]|uniref:biotin/lipoyl-binding protein n=1 Tax=unclassified Microcoleus TaxID=2642155 RepID=UPI001D6F1368|nr:MULTISPECIES: biotin/lipoyl-binding protein [unclassified Microcoleus]MCC3583503.1 biotin/lipoyl-binding protein [Microcoleus sp. PH2017_30_WIL_O_A]MCC3606500.1 biotin/lipoyl-binding protein [Microcoleus sp. PH2017_29_MFU_D_A]MCC3637593.1 biotin/lipoyl-binding protein [Microcoleus sp. PH2017_37_MFU_D_B]